MQALYLDANDEARHLSAMKKLASDTGQGLEYVRLVYEEELARLEAGARTREFLVVLAHRHVRASLAKAGRRPAARKTGA